MEEDYFCSDNRTGIPYMIPNNEVQSNIVPLNSFNSSFQNDGAIADSFVDLPASRSRMERLNADSISGHNANMNSLVSGTNFLVHNNSLQQINRSINTEPSGNLLSPWGSLESNRASNSVMYGFPAAYDGEDTGNYPKRKKLQHSIASASELDAQRHQIVSPTFIREDPSVLLQMAKMPRLDVNHGDLLRQHLYHQFLLRQDLMQVHNQNMQLKSLIQQQRQQNYLEQQIFQTVPQSNRLHGSQNEDQLRHLSQRQQTSHQISPIRSFPVGVCSRRVMQYLFHLRNRPQDNNIGYWRKFVSEYYAPGAKIRWCFSLYTNLRNHGRGGFMHAGEEGWACDVCGSRSGKGFEANFEILPRLFQNNFGSDLVDETLFLEMPQERKNPSGFLLLEYEKAVLKSVYKQGNVVREGKLRVLFRQDLKILSWEFCALKHEEFLDRHQISMQVNKLVEAAENCQTVDMTSAEDLKSNCNKFVAAGHQLARTINLPLVNGLGLPNGYVRFLQIAEVFNSLGDIMDSSSLNKMGPVECLKYYGQGESSKATQTKEMKEQCGTVRGQSTRENTPTRASFSPGSGSADSCLINDRALQAERGVRMTLPNSGKIVGRNTSISPTWRMIKQEKLCIGDQMTEIPITSRMRVPQSPNPPVTILTNRSHFESVGVSQNLEQQQLARKKRATRSTSEVSNNAYAGGQVGNSSAATGSARVLNSESLLEIKKEPNFF